MKVLKTLLVILVAGVLLATPFGCKAKTSSTTTGTQVTTVKRGNLSLDITAAGNLALSVTQDIPVDLFYPNGTKGTIASVLVQLGDSVKAGQVLVTVDNDEWNDELTVVQQNLTTAQRNVTTKSTAETDAERQLAVLQRQVTSATTAVARAQHQVDLKNLALTGAQLSVTSANDTLYQVSVVKKAQDLIDTDQTVIDLANDVLGGRLGGGLTGDFTYWTQLKANAQAALAQDRQDLQDILTGTNVTVTTDMALLVAQKQLALNQAISALVDAQNTVDDANLAVQTAQQSVDDANYAVTKQQQTLANARADLDLANNSLADAQKKLTDAQAMNPQIKAPFDGFITKVNVSGGDQVPNGTIAVILADPNKFEMNILVSEMDIMKVNIGGDATITLNAITGLTLPAKVTEIAPTATISSGVVNYAVTVNITSVPPLTSSSTPSASANVSGQFSAALQQAVQSGRITQAQADALMQGSAAGGMTTAQFSAALQQAVQSGRITQAQADALAQQIASAAGGFTARAGAASGAQSSSSSGSRTTGQLPSTVAQNYQLKQGLTGTVDLIVSQRTNVLLVPNNAITKSGTQSTVQVVSGNNTIEKRSVQTGLADWQNTEITSGLSEGEKIIIPKGTSVAPTTTTSQQRAPGIQQILR